MSTTLNIEQLNKQATDYIIRHRNSGGSSEFDTSINEISRAKIAVLKTTWKNVFLYKVNVFPYDVYKDHIQEYTGKKIYNFSCDFALNHENKELLAMMENPMGYAAFEKMFEMAGELGAVFFQWA